MPPLWIDTYKSWAREKVRKRNAGAVGRKCPRLAVAGAVEKWGRGKLPQEIMQIRKVQGRQKNGVGFDLLP